MPLILPEINDFTADSAELQKFLYVRRFLDRPMVVVDGPLVVSANTYEAYMEGIESFKNDLLSLAPVLDNTPAAELPEIQPTDITLFVLTSGSTGMPKVVAHTHETLLDRARATNLHCSHQNEDVCLAWLPFDHIGTISDWHIRPVLLGNTIVYLRKEKVLG